MSTTDLPAGVESWLNEHLDGVRTEILKVGKELSGSDSIGPEEIAQAGARVAPIRIPPVSPPPGLLKRMIEPIPGIALVSALLAIVFGIIGYCDKSDQRQGWLDITKIFAGAVVGASGVGAAKAAGAPANPRPAPGK